MGHAAAGIEVAVLGPVAVRGAERPFRRASSLELVVYLAFHRDGVSAGEWASALWPDRPVSLPTVHSTASDARRALGRTPDGREYLVRGGRLRLDDAVRTDVERFAALAASGDPERVLEAMGCVRGPLFAGLRRADWAVFDGTEAGVEAMVVGAALRGAESLVGLGRGADAERVVRRALLVSPYDERLYRALLRAAAAQGNRIGLRSTMAELLTLAGAWPGGVRRGHAAPSLACLHPETAALYRSLSGVGGASGGHPARL